MSSQGTAPPAAPTQQLDSNCFLSEFDAPPHPKWGAILAWGTFFYTLVVLLLGDASDSNGMYVKLTPHLGGASNGLMSEQVWWKGYLADLNHGFFYLLVMPWCFYFLSKFLDQADSSLRLVCKSNASVLAEVTNKNRDAFQFDWFGSKIFKLPIIFIFMVILILHNASNESKSLSSSEVSDGTVRCVGYTQREFFDRFREKFASKSTSEQLDWLKNTELRRQLEKDVYENILEEDSQLTESWTPFLSTEDSIDAQDVKNQQINRIEGKNAKGRSLSARDALQRHKLSKPIKLDLERAVSENKDLLTLDLKTNSAPLDKSKRELHGLFVFLLILLEGTCQAVGIWALLKVIFWLRMVWFLLPESTAKRETPLLWGLKLVCDILWVLWITVLMHKDWTFNSKERIIADFSDPKSSYGMRPLHTTYNTSLYILILVGFVVLTQFINTYNSGLLKPETYSEQTLTSILLVTLTGVGIASIFLGPILLFGRRMQAIKEKTIEELEKNFAGETDIEKKAKLADDLGYAENQQTWPKDDENFKFALFLALYLCVSPLALKFTDFKEIPWMDEFAKVVNYHTMLKSGVDSVCERRYGSQPPYVPSDSSRSN